MKTICLLSVFFLVSCSDTPEPKVIEPQVETEKPKKTHTILKGHQDAIQRAKDMEKEVLKNAEKQKKIIDDLDG